MNMTDPIADMLTRIRNGVQARMTEVDVAPASKVKVEIAKILKREGYIWNYEVIEGKPCNTIRIQLKYSTSGERVIQSIRKISKPGRRCYCGPKDLQPVLNGLGISILSTNKGVVSDREAREQNVGGEVLCEIW